MQLVKVASRKEGVEEYTCELESDMRKDCLELVSGNKFVGKIFLKGVVM